MLRGSRAAKSARHSYVGRLAQRESIGLTSRGSPVRSRHRPLLLSRRAGSPFRPPACATFTSLSGSVPVAVPVRSLAGRARRCTASSLWRRFPRLASYLLVAPRSARSVISSRADRDAGPRRPCPRESGRGRERCPERGAAGQGPRRLTRRGARRATRDRGGTTPAAPHRRVPRPSVRGARGVRSATKDGGCSGKGERSKWPRRSHGRSALDHEREAGRPRSTPSAGAVR